MQDYEKLGAFYLGREYDLANRKSLEDLILYDSADLTTHAVCVGMTGSGKTGLCLSLLEEAAIDGVPAICIDPKGDLCNLFLTFPDFAAEDFQPWVDEREATKRGLSPKDYAAAEAAKWKAGLASWGQPPERVARFRESVDMAIYTPGSTAGLPLTVLKSFAPPSDAVIDDEDAFRQHLSSAASGLLALVGIEADPVRDREHILLSNLLDKAWREGRDLSIAELIGEIQEPPFEKVGIIDLETFFPQKDRIKLALELNNLLASPSFAGWLEGEPLDVGRLLYTEEGKPRLSVISIAHLSDAERMFFVTILLNEVLAWVRGQSGTSSLRALLYMDEVYGYFPPVKNPPSKTPMLTLLKQARAFGLGVVLATQNPVDLDYKGLSNAGTWFLGRLQTERDKLRVLEGLEGAAAQTGSAFDRGRIDEMLAALGSRVFLMNNVHEDQPVVFQTRWALSYLRGPLTRRQIQTLMHPKVAGAPKVDGALRDPKEKATALLGVEDGVAEQLPSVSEVLPHELPCIEGLKTRFLRREIEPADGERLIYRPAVLAHARLHFVRSAYKLDTWRDCRRLAIAADSLDDLWRTAAPILEGELAFDDAPAAGAAFAELPDSLTGARAAASLTKRLGDHLYKTEEFIVWRSPDYREYSEARETLGQFRVRLRTLSHEKRDREKEKLRDKYTSKLSTIKSRMETARRYLAEEQAQANRATVDSAMTFGTSILGALFGRKLASATNARRASRTVRSAGRVVDQRGDVGRAKAKLDDLQQEYSDLEQEFRQEADAVDAEYRQDDFRLERLAVRPRKKDIEIDDPELIWTPWSADSAGTAQPMYGLDVVAATPV